MPRRKNTAPTRNVSDDSRPEIGLGFVVKKRRKSGKRSTTEPNNFKATIQKCDHEEMKLFLGKLSIGTTLNALPDDWTKCTLIGDENSLKLKFDDNSDIVVQLSVDVNMIKTIFTSKLFRFLFNINEETQFHLMIHFRELPIVKMNKNVAFILKRLMADFFDIDVTDVYESGTQIHEDAEDLYEGVKNYREHNLSVINHEQNIQHPHLLPKLRPYQANAVRWMIKNEEITIKELLHPMYMSLKLESGLEIYYNKYTGGIESVKPVVKFVETGGILADEMGLGKTVEVLACILNNPRNVDNNSIALKAPVHDPETNDLMPIQTKTKAEISELPVTVTEFQIRDTCEEQLIPTIKTQKKFVKPKQKVAKITKAKDVRFSNLSPTKRAAQIWYEEKLAELKIKAKPKAITTVEIQCICGDFTRNGIVTCSDCKKMQHATCMNFKNVDKVYCCPQCWFNKPLIKSKATLIVSPTTINRQWSLEIQRHIRKNGLKVLEYKGIHHAGMVYPTELADYDLVITTYSVLQSELRFTSDQKAPFSFRNVKRYNTPTTPLLFIEWWRLCLDEAQSIECPTSQVSCMAQQLNAVHRWAVTGTPVQKTITDLYSLIEYLQLSPYNDISTWNHILYYPYAMGNKNAMFEFLSKILWRSVKVDVIEQINIPPQTIKEHWFDFSAVEKFFYKREHETCAVNFLARLSNFETLDITLTSIDRQLLNTILTPLLSLRQLCSHPYTVRGRYLATKRQVTSMEDLLDALIKKNIKECEESLRTVIAALNGVAGILLLQNRSIEAVEIYRESLLFITKYDNQDFIKMDKLQCIHTLYNLNEVLSDKSYPTPPPTLRDEKLKDECEEFQNRYMGKYISQTNNALQDVKKATAIVDKQIKLMVYKEGEWCAEVLEWMIEKSLDNEMMRRLYSVDTGVKSKFSEFPDVKAITYVLTTWIDHIAKQSLKLRKLFKKFEVAFYTNGNTNCINEDLVNSAMECHLRPAKSDNWKKKCLCCILDKDLKIFECIIFQMSKRSTYRGEDSNMGTWHPCLEEHMLKVIHQFARFKGADCALIEEGEKHIVLCEKRRKEFKELRKLYTFYDQQVSAQDELNICKIRFRLRNAEGPMKDIRQKSKVLRNLDYKVDNKYEFIYLMSESELDYHYNGLQGEKIRYETKLKNYLGTHSYLETLRKQQYSGQNPDPCPICQCQLVDSWSILLCGHCYCLDCIHKILDQFNNAKHVTCSVCRKKQLCEDISYIKLKSGTVENPDESEIIGSHSTKIHAVVKTAVDLLNMDSDVKILIFSKWKPVLKVISDALSLNHISHEFLASYRFQDKLKKFKDPENNITALLLPVHLGAKGLNLIEATHVFLVDPLMNPSEELQAIGRVHRIGQTRPTVVHRFLIKNTVEESIHNAISANAKQWHDKKLTLAQLKTLFTEVTE